MQKSRKNQPIRRFSSLRPPPYTLQIYFRPQSELILALPIGVAREEVQEDSEAGEGIVAAQEGVRAVEGVLFVEPP